MPATPVSTSAWYCRGFSARSTSSSPGLQSSRRRRAVAACAARRASAHSGSSSSRSRRRPIQPLASRTLTSRTNQGEVSQKSVGKTVRLPASSMRIGRLTITCGSPQRSLAATATTPRGLRPSCRWRISRSASVASVQPHIAKGLAVSRPIADASTCLCRPPVRACDRFPPAGAQKSPAPAAPLPRRQAEGLSSYRIIASSEVAAGCPASPLRIEAAAEGCQPLVALFQEPAQLLLEGLAGGCRAPGPAGLAPVGIAGTTVGLADGQADLAVPDVDDLHLHQVVLFQVIMDVVDIGVGHFGDVHQARLTLFEFDESPEMGDPGHPALDNAADFQ